MWIMLKLVIGLLVRNAIRRSPLSMKLAVAAEVLAGDTPLGGERRACLAQWERAGAGEGGLGVVRE